MKIFLDSPIFDGIFNLAKSHEIEWTAYAKAEKTGRNAFHLTDLILPYQENTSGTTEVNATAQEIDGKKFDPTLEWRTRDRKIEDPQTWRGPEWNVWIHSHNTMSAFWSGTDWTEINNMMEERSEPFLCIVVNASMEYQALIGIPALDLTFEVEIESYEPTITELLKKKKEQQELILKRWQYLVESTKDLETKLEKYEIKPIVPVYKQQTSYNNFGFYNQQENWEAQCDFVEELKKDTTITNNVSQKNMAECPDLTEGWYECDLDGNVIQDVEYPYQEIRNIRKRGNVIMYFDDFLKPLGLYRGYKSNRQKNVIKKYNELFKHIIKPTTDLFGAEGLAE